MFSPTRRIFLMSFGGILLISGLILGYFFSKNHTPPQSSPSNNCQSYPLVNQSLDCGTIHENISFISTLDSKIRAIIENETEKKNITRASVFYRDLTTRRWFGINDTENFYAASLLKLPLSIMYYKMSEVAPTILDQKFTLGTQDRNSQSVYTSPKNLLTPGKNYTVKEMIEGMIIDSDNNPIPVLNELIDPKLRSAMLHDLGIEPLISSSTTPGQYINVRIYSNILRFLYNSSYLNLHNSNTLLEYLSRTTFDKGIVASIPSDITVAHKFGEATKYAPDGSVESRILHDCGIVYDPGNPYIICIMTEGTDFTSMSHTMQAIAAATFHLDY